MERRQAVAESARVERRGLWQQDVFLCQPSDFRRGRCR